VSLYCADWTVSFARNLAELCRTARSQIIVDLGKICQLDCADADQVVMLKSCIAIPNKNGILVVLYMIIQGT